MKRIVLNILFAIALIIIILIISIRAAFAQTIQIANNNPGATTSEMFYTGNTALRMQPLLTPEHDF